MPIFEVIPQIEINNETLNKLVKLANNLSGGKIGSAWNEALKNSDLTATSSMGAIHRTVKQIVTNILAKPEQAPPSFRNYISAALPQLYSTSSQGIVVGGNLANDIRILNNTIDGTAQGIHVGLSDQKAVPHVSHYLIHLGAI